MWMRSGAETPGGARVQLTSTAHRLRDLGVEVREFFGGDAPLDGVDLVHGFGLSPDDIRRSRSHRLPVVVSTIYWDRRYQTGEFHNRVDRVEVKSRLRRGAILSLAAMQNRWVEKSSAMLESVRQQTLVFESADLLLPNSQLEAEAIAAELGVTTPSHPVPNAVEPELFSVAGNESRIESQPARDVVMCAGRFEPHKNQLAVIRALRGSPYHLLLAGQEIPAHSEYMRRCRAEAGKNVTFFLLAPGASDLPSLYRTARVHVLASWFETTGLVSLEASISGCNVVSTSRGYAREYLGDDAWYCDPERPDSIRAAIDAAWMAPYAEALADRIRKQFTWTHTAEATLAGYRTVLDR
jgi:glycosyltransferase involved in cell wall biosynthesis